MVIEIVMMADNIDVMSARAECGDHRKLQNHSDRSEKKRHVGHSECSVAHSCSSRVVPAAKNRAHFELMFSNVFFCKSSSRKFCVYPNNKKKRSYNALLICLAHFRLPPPNLSK